MSREYRFIRAGSYEFHLRYVIMTQEADGPDGRDVIVTMRPGREIRLQGADAESFRAGFRDAVRPPNPDQPPGGAASTRLYKRDTRPPNQAEGGE